MTEQLQGFFARCRYGSIVFLLCLLFTGCTTPAWAEKAAGEGKVNEEASDSVQESAYVETADSALDSAYVESTDSTQDTAYVESTDAAQDTDYVESTDSTQDIAYVETGYSVQEPESGELTDSGREPASGEEAADAQKFPPVSLTVPVPELKARSRGKRVEFSWTADQAFYGYHIYETNEEGTIHTLRKKTRKDHWKMKGLTPGKTYYFQLRAYGRSGDKALWTDWGKPVKVMVANDNPSVFSRLRFGGALSVLHADNYGSLEKVRLAVERKFYAVECDYNYSGGVMWCTHDTVAETTGTFEDHVKICQPGGTKLVIDLKTDYDEALNALGTYIRDNNLEDWVLVQTNNQYAMSRLNEIVGSKLEYWGLVMANYDTVYELTGNAQTYKDLGMTTVNIPKYVEGTAYVLGTQGTVQSLIDAGYEVCVFTWGEFSDWDKENYPAWGARFMMTDNLNQM